MAIFVRSADINTDERLITDFLLRNHTPDSNHKRFNWLYRNGPAGPARVWLASESETHEIVGIAAAFPRRVYLGDHEANGWILGDFCVAKRYRSLGAAIQLQRACLASVDSSRDGVYVDFPSAAMTAVYRRLGIKAYQQVVRLAKPLRVDGKVESVIRQRHVARLISSVVNTGLALRNGKPRPRPGSVVAVFKGLCGDEFTRLAQSIGSTMGICLERSGGYLNWRYREHPYRAYDIITLRCQDSLLGYAVVRPEGRHLSLVDMFGKGEILPELLAGVISIARDRKLDTVTAGLIASHRWIKMFGDLGFHRRESFAVVTRCQNKNGDPSAHDGNEWFLMNGDRES
jgi:hypothetical protein